MRLRSSGRNSYAQSARDCAACSPRELGDDSPVPRGALAPPRPTEERRPTRNRRRGRAGTAVRRRDADELPRRLRIGRPCCQRLSVVLPRKEARDRPRERNPLRPSINTAHGAAETLAADMGYGTQSEPWSKADSTQRTLGTDRCVRGPAVFRRVSAWRTVSSGVDGRPSWPNRVDTCRRWAERGSS